MKIRENQVLGHGVINNVNLHKAENIVKALNLTIDFDYVEPERPQFL